MAIMNREMAPNIETIFLAPEAEHIFLSSSAVKEVWHSGGDIRPFVPEAVARAFERLKPKPVKPLATRRRRKSK
jgi:pantetheine-phosphate adenylyltransferase